MAKRSDETPEALRNRDVTGLTPEKREQVVEESGEAPRRKAAEKMLDEQREEARRTSAPNEPPRSRSSGEQTGVIRGGEGEHEHRWVDAARAVPNPRQPRGKSEAGE